MHAPQAAHILRYLRNKIILAVILFLSATYSLYSFGFNMQNSESALRTKFDSVKSFRDSKLFIWNTNATKNDKTTSPGSCRNSLQGRDLIADDLGYVCRRLDVMSNGCCDTNVTFTQRYVCHYCLENNCCEIYEHCLSCCMNPDKRPLLENVLRTLSSRFQFILSETKDQYELCLVKCRTNSKSVYHGNMYRNPGYKYCYGKQSEDKGSTFA